MDLVTIVALLGLATSVFIYYLTRTRPIPYNGNELILLVVLAFHGLNLVISMASVSGLLNTSLRAATFIVDLYTIRCFYLKHRGLVKTPLEAWR